MKLDLKTAQAANQVIESLRSTGKLPSNYITKSQAISMGWRPGKALGNTIKNGQLGGDIFANSTNIFPAKQNRIWYEANIGSINIYVKIQIRLVLDCYILTMDCYI